MTFPPIVEFTSDEFGKRTISVRWARLSLVCAVLGILAWICAAFALWFFVAKFNDFPGAKFTDILFPARWDNYRSTQGDHYIKQADEFVAKNDYISAFAKLRVGVAKSPGNSHGRILLAQFYVANRRPDLAADVLLGGLPLLQNDRAYLQDALRFLLDFKEDAKLLTVARELLRSSSLSVDDKRLVAFFAATAAFYRGNFDQAEDLMVNHRLTETTDGVILQARLDWERGYPEIAILRLQSHLQVVPENESIYVQLGRFFRERGDLASLEQNAVQRLALNPLSHAPRLEFLYLYDQRKQAARLEQEIESYLRNFSREPTALLALADFAANTGKPALASRVNTINRTGLKPVEGPALMVAEAHIVAGEYQQALTLIAEYKRASPEWTKQFASIFNGLQTVALYGLGKPDEARLFLEHLLGQADLRAENLVAVSNRLASIGVRDQARVLLARAFEADPLNQAALTQLVRLETADNVVEPLPGHLRQLMKMRQPSREVLQAAYDRLAGDINLFLAPQVELLAALKSALANSPGQKI